MAIKITEKAVKEINLAIEEERTQGITRIIGRKLNKGNTHVTYIV